MSGEQIVVRVEIRRGAKTFAAEDVYEGEITFRRLYFAARATLARMELAQLLAEKTAEEKR